MTSSPGDYWKCRASRTDHHPWERCRTVQRDRGFGERKLAHINVQVTNGDLVWATNAAPGREGLKARAWDQQNKWEGTRAGERRGGRGERGKNGVCAHTLNVWGRWGNGQEGHRWAHHRSRKALYSELTLKNKLVSHRREYPILTFRIVEYFLRKALSCNSPGPLPTTPKKTPTSLLL